MTTIQLFPEMVNDDYRLVWHISALSQHRFHITIRADNQIIEEVTYSGKDFEQCLSMKQYQSKKNQSLFMDIESDCPNIEIKKDSRIDESGQGSSTCFFVRGDKKANYHELCILLWAVKEAKNYEKCIEEENNSFSYPLRNLAHLTCVSYFFCFHKNEDIHIKLYENIPGKGTIKYLDEDFNYTGNHFHLVSGSILTKKHGLDLEMVYKKGTVQAYVDSTVISGCSQKLVHYHIKSGNVSNGHLPFSMDIIGWTDME
ncbi:MAG: hypothetical protein ACLUVC_13925 [Longibaculum sp.]